MTMERMNRRTFLSRAAVGVAVAPAAARLAAVGAPDAQTCIVVDSGPFDSIEAAAFGESEVDWSDPGGRAATACTQCFAAVELQQYLRKITGDTDDFTLVQPGEGDLPPGNLVLLGQPGTLSELDGITAASGTEPTDLKVLGAEGYHIRTGREGSRRVLAIWGGGRVGVLYGVYEFLHRLGCRWFAPGEIHEEIPSLQFGEFPEMDIAEKPDLALRGFWAFEGRGNDDFFMWMVRNRLNYWSAEEENHTFLRKLGMRLCWGGHEIGFAYLRPNDPYPYAHEGVDFGQDLPPDPYPVSPYFKGDVDGDGVLTYREAHPEWYAMTEDGERVTTLGDFDYNYCTSNPHATAELTKNAVQELIDGIARNAEIVNCWLVDVGTWCKCDACKALGTPTDRNLLFVHAFDKAVKQAQADGRINRPITLLFLAYADVLEPPTRPLPADFDYDTCIATYFPIHRNYVFNIDDPVCPINSNYVDHLQGWSMEPDRYYQGAICIGEYYNVSGYKSLPIVYMHTMQNDIPWYYKTAEARYFHYMHVTTKNWGNKALTNYQFARQLWNHETDCDALWADYFDQRYGPAADDMRRFYGALETMFGNCTEIKYDLRYRLIEGADDLFPNPTMRYRPNPEEPGSGPSWLEIMEASETGREIIDEVLERTDLSERIRVRLREDEFMFTYGEQTLRFYDALIHAFLAEQEGEFEKAREAFAEACRLAQRLNEETEAPAHAHSCLHARNALTASMVGASLAVLADRLGAPEPDALPTYDLSTESAPLMGNDFIGGGAMIYGFGLGRLPHVIDFTDNGNHVYAAQSRHHRIFTFFRVPSAPDEPVHAVMTGISWPASSDDGVDGRITVNDTVVFEGPMPFAERTLTDHSFEIPADVFVEGVNTVIVENVMPLGPMGGRPWFGIHKFVLERS